MKITKFVVGVFIFTFIFGLIGYISVLKLNKTIKSRENIRSVSTDNSKTEVKEKKGLEVVEGEFPSVSHPLSMEIIETGEGFHKDGFEVKSGETWLGLFQEEDKHYLRPVKTIVRPSHNPLVDDKPWQKSGKSLKVEGKNQPIFLLKNADDLAVGEVRTLVSRTKDNEKSYQINRGDFRGFKFNYDKYVLDVIEAKNEDGEKILALVLSGRGKRQILHTVKVSFSSDFLGYVNWVGDLDGDKRPDFYLDLFQNESASFKYLFLSSEADSDKLVKVAAFFVDGNC